MDKNKVLQYIIPTTQDENIEGIVDICNSWGILDISSFRSKTNKEKCSGFMQLFIYF